MHKEKLLTAALIALLAACGEKEKPKEPPKETPAEKAPEKPKEPPRLTPGPISVKSINYPDLTGEYDGTKAFAKSYGAGLSVVFFPRNCATFGCGDIPGPFVDSNKLKGSCPNGYFLSVELKGEELKKGEMTIDRVGGSDIAKESAYGFIGKGNVNLLEAGDTLLGTVDFKDTEPISGTFQATVCKTQ